MKAHIKILKSGAESRTFNYETKEDLSYALGQANAYRTILELMENERSE